MSAYAETQNRKGGARSEQVPHKDVHTVWQDEDKGQDTDLLVDTRS
jgi:hypothetical protein